MCAVSVFMRFLFRVEEKAYNHKCSFYGIIHYIHILLHTDGSACYKYYYNNIYNIYNILRNYALTPKSGPLFYLFFLFDFVVCAVCEVCIIMMITIITLGVALADIILLVMVAV